jgi:hypothetical protein
MVSSPSSFRNPEIQDGCWIPGSREGARPGMTAKKEPPFPAAFEVDNREASNRVDRSHSVSKQGQSSNSRESLIDRKRTVLFKRG